jgi:hypothetical protein
MNSANIGDCNTGKAQKQSLRAEVCLVSGENEMDRATLPAWQRERAVPPPSLHQSCRDRTETTSEGMQENERCERSRSTNEPSGSRRPHSDSEGSRGTQAISLTVPCEAK